MYNFSLYYQNVRGLRSKLFNLHSNFVLLSYDIYLLTETWLSDDRSLLSSNCSRGGGVLIAIKDTLRPAFIRPSMSNVEQLFIRISLHHGLSALISVVYIPPSADISQYDSYVKSVEDAWDSANCDLGMFFGDFNLPGVSWSSVNQSLVYSGAVNNKSSLIGDQFISMDFLQLNSIHNHSGSLLDLIFTNAHTASVEEAPDSLVPCDGYHPSLSFKFKVPIPLTMLDDKHSFRDFKNADYNAISLALSDNDWISTFIHQPADISASILQNSLIDSINRFVPLKTFRRSSFPAWISSKLKSLLF